MTGKSRISRYGPLRTLAALAAVALVATGCRSAVGEQRSDGGVPSEPTDGGTLRIGATTDLVPTSVFTNSSDGMDTTVGLVYDSLVDYPPKRLDPEPSLATSWRLAEDGRSMTLQLRDDVTFHNGREFTSEDVEFSIKTWADPKWTVQFQRTAEAVTGFDTSKPHEITLEFAHPLGNIVDLLDTVPIIDRTSMDELESGEDFVGTGPFTFDSWTPNSQITYGRNEDYWREGRPYLDGVELNIVSDPQALVSQLRAGQLDGVFGASSRDVETLEESGMSESLIFKGAEQQVYVGANVTNPVLEDIRLRRAIAYAIDRERIVDDVYRGKGYAINLPWPTYSPAYDEKLNSTYEYDPDKARELVEAVGDVPTLPLGYSSDNPDWEATAQIVQSNLEDVGIPVELGPVDHAQFIKQLIGAEFEGLWILDHSYAQYTPSTISVSAYPFNADANASRFSSDDYKQDAEAAWKIADGTSAEAERAYDRVSEDLLDNLFLIEMATHYRELATSHDVHGVTWTKRGEPVFTNAFLEED